MERPLTVGQLAHATGVPAKTIRYYEQVGVLPVPRRSATGYRHYSRHDVHRLLFIRRARALEQIPRSLRRNPLPVKRINRSLLMGHKYPAGALV